MLVAAVVLAALVAGTNAAAQTLTVERLASLPRLAGTPPTGPQWSFDGHHLAFLWNDHGMPFRDVWVFSIGDRQPRRLTNLETSEPPAQAESSSAAAPDWAHAAAAILAPLQAQAATRADGGISEFTWAPDGRSILFVRRGKPYRVGAGDGRIVPILSDSVRSWGSVGQLRFSPDGHYLALVAGDRLREIPVVNGELDEAHAQSPGLLDGAGLTSFEWSPDSHVVAALFTDERRSRKLLFPDYVPDEVTVRTEPRDYTADQNTEERFALHRIGSPAWQPVALEGTKERVTSNYSWSPDSRSLLIDRNGPDAPCRWLETITAGDGSVKAVWVDPNRNRSYTTPWYSAWSSDGRAVLFLSDLDGWVHLYSVPVGERAAPRQLTTGPWEIVHSSGYSPVELLVSKAGDVYFIATKKNPQERQVYRVSERGGEVTLVTSRAGFHTPLLSPDGSRLALLHSDDVTPTELYMQAVATPGAEQRVTRSPLPEYDRYQWVTPQYVTFKSHVDGAEIRGRLLVPPGLEAGKRYPVILGPVYIDTVRDQWQERWSLIQQYLVIEKRYVVLQVDSRGSSGHGAAFRYAFQYRCGAIDIDDLESGVRYLSTLPYADTSRAGIWGTSYGGLLTVQSLLKKPGLFKAGVAGAPATNVWHAGVSEYRLFGDPVAHADAYRQGSAISFGEQLRDHLMIIHGMQDSTVLFRDSVALVEKLMLLGRDVDFVVAPSAVHAWTQKDYNARYLLTKLVDYFDHYLR